MPARLVGAFPPSIRARDVRANCAAAFCAGLPLAPSPFGTIRRKMPGNANRWRNSAIWLLIPRESIAVNHRQEERRSILRLVTGEIVASDLGSLTRFPRCSLRY